MLGKDWEMLREELETLVGDVKTRGDVSGRLGEMLVGD